VIVLMTNMRFKIIEFEKPYAVLDSFDTMTNRLNTNPLWQGNV